MKKMRKIFALLIAMVLVLSMGTSVFAAADDKGSITVENAAKGATYKAYKVFDATPNADNTAVTYKIAESNTALLDAVRAATDVFAVSEVASAGYYSVDRAEGAADDAIISWLGENVSLFGDPVTGVYQDSDGTVLFDKLPYGYYYVTSSMGAAVSVDTNSPNATIKDKNPTIPDELDKTVEEADEATAQIGTIQDYSVSFNATNYVTTGSGTDVQSKQVTEYVVEDTYVNLRILDASTITVTVNGDIINLPATNIVVTPNADDATGGTLKITIPWADENGNNLYEYKEGEDEGTTATSIPVVITYQAEVTSAALDKANNDVSVTHDGGGDPLTDSTETTTYDFTIDKDDENGEPLAGAVFSMTNKDTNEVINVVKVAKGDPKTAAAEDATEWDYRVADSKETGTTEIVSDADGEVTIYGLDATTYTLKETQAPVGYNPADDQDVTVPGQTSVTIVNQQGSVLPSTGGIGTTMFYVIGSVLVIGAAVVLISKRRMAR